MTGAERIVAALRREQPDCIPTFEWFIDESVGQALTGTSDAIEIVEVLDLDGINIRADYQRQFTSDTVFRDERGAVGQLTGDCIASIRESPIRDIARHRDYRFPDPRAGHRFATVERGLDRFGDRRAIVLNLRDGWSDMRDLLGYEQCLVNLMLERELFVELLGRVVEYNLALAEVARERYGLNIVATTDDVANADGPLVSPAVYGDILAPALERVIRGYKELGFFCIKHCDGDVTPLIDGWIDAGIDCIDPVDPGAGLELGDFKQRYGDRICLKGNVDCTGNLCHGSAADVEQEVIRCVQQGGPGGYILSSSNTIHRGVKPENYRAMLNALREHGGRGG